MKHETMRYAPTATTSWGCSMNRFIMWYMKQVERIVDKVTVPNPEYIKAHEPEPESWVAEDFLFD